MINNFVDFITDTISPDIINDYLENGGGSPSDFVGSDESTMDYTKAGWMLKCYMDMLNKGQVTSDVTDVTRMIMNFDCLDGKKNYECISPSGYNLLQMMAYEARQYPDFVIDDVSDILDIDHLLANYHQTARSVGQQTFVHMIAEFMEDKLISSIDEGDISVGKQVDDGVQNRLIAPYYLALKNTGDAISAGKVPEIERSTLDALRGHITSGVSYREFIGDDGYYTGADQYPTNELSKFIAASSHETIKSVVEKIPEYLLPIVDTSSEQQEVRRISDALKDAAVEYGGLSISKSRFDIGRYIAGTQENEYNNGYTPMMYYVGKYRGECDINVLNRLANVYNPLALSVDNSSFSEGFTPLSVLADNMTIVGDDYSSWSRPELASFIKRFVSTVSDGSNPYKTYVAAGVVFLVTNGSSNNSFGVVNNIMLKINEAHKSWYDEQSDDTISPSDFEDTYNTLAGAILPSEFDYSFYASWMNEFEKNIQI